MTARGTCLAPGEGTMSVAGSTSAAAGATIGRAITREDRRIYLLVLFFHWVFESFLFSSAILLSGSVVGLFAGKGKKDYTTLRFLFLECAAFRCVFGWACKEGRILPSEERFLPAFLRFLDYVEVAREQARPFGGGKQASRQAVVVGQTLARRNSC